MAASDKVFIAALLLMTMLSISHRGVSAQSTACKTMVRKCITDELCKTEWRCIDQASACSNEEKAVDKQKLIEEGCNSSQSTACKTMPRICVSDDICKTVWRCIDQASACSNEEKEVDKQKLIKEGCSGSGIPIISAMSLFVAAFFHML